MSEQPAPEQRYRRSKQEMEEGLDDIFSMLRQGYTIPMIRQQLKAKGLEKKTIQRDIKAAKDLIAALGKEATEYQIGKMNARLDYIYSHTSIGPKQDFKIALRTVEVQTRLIPKVISQSNLQGAPPDAIQSHAQPDVVSTRLAELFRDYQRQRPSNESQNGPGDA